MVSELLNMTNTLKNSFSPPCYSRVDQSTPVLLDDPVLASMAKKYKQTPALIALRYQIQRGVVVLAKSLNEARIKENMQVMSEALGFSGPNKITLCSTSPAQKTCLNLVLLSYISKQVYFISI